MEGLITSVQVVRIPREEVTVESAIDDDWSLTLHGIEETPEIILTIRPEGGIDAALADLLGTGNVRITSAEAPV